jgi:hypothetical protein
LSWKKAKEIYDELKTPEENVGYVGVAAVAYSEKTHKFYRFNVEADASFSEINVEVERLNESEVK